MPTKAASESATRTGPVTMTEALERLLSQCNNNPHEVAEWLNIQHRTGKIRLFGVPKELAPGSTPVMMSAAANPRMLQVVARIPTDGRVALDIGGLGIGYQDWTFERESFEANLPGAPVNRGGRPRTYDREAILIEAAMAIYEDGLPEPFSLESFADAVALRLGDASPGIST